MARGDLCLASCSLPSMMTMTRSGVVGEWMRMYYLVIVVVVVVSGVGASGEQVVARDNAAMVTGHKVSPLSDLGHSAANPSPEDRTKRDNSAREHQQLLTLQTLPLHVQREATADEELFREKREEKELSRQKRVATDTAKRAETGHLEEIDEDEGTELLRVKRLMTERPVEDVRQEPGSQAGKDTVSDLQTKPQAEPDVEDETLTSETGEWREGSEGTDRGSYQILSLAQPSLKVKNSVYEPELSRKKRTEHTNEHLPVESPLSHRLIIDEEELSRQKRDDVAETKPLFSQEWVVANEVGLSRVKRTDLADGQSHGTPGQNALSALSHVQRMEEGEVRRSGEVRVESESDPGQLEQPQKLLTHTAGPADGDTEGLPENGQSSLPLDMNSENAPPPHSRRLLAISTMKDSSMTGEEPLSRQKRSSEQTPTASRSRQKRDVVPAATDASDSANPQPALAQREAELLERVRKGPEHKFYHEELLLRRLKQARTEKRRKRQEPGPEDLDGWEHELSMREDLAEKAIEYGIQKKKERTENPMSDRELSILQRIRHDAEEILRRRAEEAMYKQQASAERKLAQMAGKEARQSQERDEEEEDEEDEAEDDSGQEDQGERGREGKKTDKAIRQLLKLSPPRAVVKHFPVHVDVKKPDIQDHRIEAMTTPSPRADGTVLRFEPQEVYKDKGRPRRRTSSYKGKRKKKSRSKSRKRDALFDALGLTFPPQSED